MTQQQKIDAYLARIGFEGVPRLDFDTLHTLQRQHLQTIPYENLDILQGIPLSLDIDDLFEKIVLRRRGGYCFELNALFAWLLRSLGFEVTDYFARFLLNEPEIPMRRHHVLGVSFGSEAYLCDVGVGLLIPRMPIPLAAGAVSKQNDECYKLEKEDFFGYVLYELKAEGWRQLYSFTTELQLPVDFVATSFYCENFPESIFRNVKMVHIFTEDGRKSMTDDELRVFSSSGVEVIPIATKAEETRILKWHFGIDLGRL
ncbi:MAG: arylamine N-acetyltransferase [Defluviitaleaceae bacterium]|nr:arylamine N-acetyltransferase [Defluviitaleaceae bacterium]